MVGSTTNELFSNFVVSRYDNTRYKRGGMIVVHFFFRISGTQYKYRKRNGRTSWVETRRDETKRVELSQALSLSYILPHTWCELKPNDTEPNHTEPNRIESNRTEVHRNKTRINMVCGLRAKLTPSKTINSTKYSVAAAFVRNSRRKS